MAIYLLCIEFMNTTTYNIIPLEECKKCFLVKVEPISNKKLTHMEIQYYISLWIWYLRKKEWQSAVNIYNQLVDTSQWPQMDDPELCYTNTNLLEGSLLLLVRKINSNDLDRIVYIKKFTRTLFKRIKKLSRNLKCLKSRYFLYMAYYKMIHRHKKEASLYLNKAEAYSIGCSNYYDRDWIRHTRRIWSNWPASGKNDEWIASAKLEKVLNSNGDGLDEKITLFFTLRLPARKN